MLAIIGGSGLYALGQFTPGEPITRATPYGDTSAEISRGDWHGIPLAFLPRHGDGHRVPPHRVNYRANLWALHQAGVRQIIAVNAVGGITPDMPPLTLALPDQIVDYTSGRAHTFFDGGDDPVTHIDFSSPYSALLRAILLDAALELGQELIGSATYGCSNGPRLETAAEIERMRRDGCHLVGMTGMPETALARELDIDYASLALVVNWAAGVVDQAISMQAIVDNMEQGMRPIEALLLTAARMLRQ